MTTEERNAQDTWVDGHFISNLHKLDDEAVLFGSTYIFGAKYYVYCIRVIEGGNSKGEAVDDPHGRLDDVYAQDPDAGPRMQVKIPGYNGWYVIQLVNAAQ